MGRLPCEARIPCESRVIESFPVSFDSSVDPGEMSGDGDGGRAPHLPLSNFEPHRGAGLGLRRSSKYSPNVLMGFESDSCPVQTTIQTMGGSILLPLFA